MQLKEIEIEPKEQDIGKRRASLAGQVSPARGEATTRTKRPRLPDRACRGSRGLNHPTNHSSTTHVVNQCGVKLQDDYVEAIRHMAAISYRRNPQMTPVLRRVKGTCAELAR